MKLYVIRHGESETNLKNVYSGWMDVALTEKGFEDAKGAQKLLSGIQFDKIYTSDLMRAKKTAETAIPGCVYEETPLLREINVGNLAGKPANIAHIKNLDFTPYNGENCEMVRARLQRFLDALNVNEHQNVAVFSHAGCLREILNLLLETTIPGKSLICQNCTVAIFDHNGERWRLHSWINP